MAQPDSPAHVAILPSPGMGHLIPLAELAKRLVHQHNCSITFVIPTDGSPSKAQRSVLGSLPTTIRSVFLPPVNLSDLPEDVKIETTISLTVAREMKEPVKIPGCLPIDGGELLDPAQDRKNDAYKWLLYHTKRYRLAEGVMVNSFTDLEKGALQALQEVEAGKPAVYPVGPLVNMDSSTGVEGSECLKWLDDQPHGSVLFVSFGSGGTLSLDQITELALGLEMITKTLSISYRKGFLERTKGRGLVVPSWAPQPQVLSHGSTGGFLTHCGWNSTLESVVSGVPLIVWPLYAEQKMNAWMLTQDIKVALRPKASGQWPHRKRGDCKCCERSNGGRGGEEGPQ
ncbi:hypothetical protein OIU76_007934 [Salix suchowensis]|nr:hypothetical protein OIU76_007934 [Salix suchowensis]